jgi:trk system potassium uptake protein TrkH
MYKRVINFFGLFLILFGICMLVPFFVALIYHESFAGRVFLISSETAIVPGVVIVFVYRNTFSREKLKQRDNYFIVTVCWILASVLGSIPYLIGGYITDPVDAFFETAAGFSTTGASIIPDVEVLPKSILFWRSFTQWLGGMGIMVLLVALFPSFGIKGRSIATVETPGPTVSNISSKFTGTAQKLYIVYIILTFVETALLMIGGLNPFDALTHSFTTMATGGFSTYNDSIAHFSNTYILWVFIIFMFLAGVNFNLLFIAAHGKIRLALKDEELRTYLKIIVLSSFLIGLFLYIKNVYTNPGEIATHSIFQVTAILSTTGFETTDFSYWPAFCQMILLLLMFTGGSSFSTAGGTKISRALVSVKAIRFELTHKLHGNIINDIKYNGKKVPPETLSHTISYMTTYILTLVIGTMLLTFASNEDFMTDFSAVLSCISNVGPGLYRVGPMHNYAFYPAFGKLVLSVVMIAGRLELTAFILLFTKSFWKPNRV